MSNLKEELLERYESTGRVGLIKPSSTEEAYSMINTIVELYEQEPEDNSFTLKEVVEKLNNFLNDF